MIIHRQIYQSVGYPTFFENCRKYTAERIPCNMDIRIEKTKQGIINAFIELRSRKEIERITIKELCEKAQINKSTFYSHYHDIYDLTDKLETEIVTSILENFNHPENLIQNPAAFARELFVGYLAKDALINTVFSGSRSKYLVQKIEKTLKNFIFSIYPQYRDDPQINTMLTYILYGGYYAFYENRRYGDPLIISTIADLTDKSTSMPYFLNRN